MNPNHLDPKLITLINDLSNDFKEIVEDIEARPMTTQNHYGDYGGLITALSKDHPTETYKQLISIALIRAGASKDGIFYAMKVLV